MPNIKSAKKRVLVTAKKTARNKSIKSEVKTEVKKFLATVESGDKKSATALFPHVCSVIDSAVSKGILKKNTAANKKRQTFTQLFQIICFCLVSKFNLNQTEYGIINHVHIISIHSFRNQSLS